MRAETALRESEQRYHDLFEAAQRQAQELTLLDRVRTAVTRELNLAELFRTVVTAIAESFGYALVSLYILDGNILRLQHQVGYDIVLEDIPITSGLWAVRPGLVSPVVANAYSDPCLSSDDGRHHLEIAAPVVDAGQTVGVLNIEAHEASPDRSRSAFDDCLERTRGQRHYRARLYTEARQNAARLTAA
jgi:putative methionine-R-sulfoxide reductase with GAF domain